MSRKLIVILISLLTCFAIMSGGYGIWSDELLVDGNIKVVPDPEVLAQMEDELASLEEKLAEEILAEQLRLEEEQRLFEEQLEAQRLAEEQRLLEEQLKLIKEKILGGGEAPPSQEETKPESTITESVIVPEEPTPQAVVEPEVEPDKEIEEIKPETSDDKVDTGSEFKEPEKEKEAEKDNISEPEGDKESNSSDLESDNEDKYTSSDTDEELSSNVEADNSIE